MAPSGSHLSKKTAKERAREYKHAEFYEDGGVLFCRACARAVDHCCKSTSRATVIARMLEQGTPLNKKVAKNHRKTGAGASGMPRKQSRQQTLESSITAGEARNDVVLRFLDALISANIPLEKVDKPETESISTDTRSERQIGAWI
ncbi:hypothetical protein MTO96_024953 [Rhipicephalus appendiculatus]